MSPETVIDLGRQALVTSLLIGSPMLVVGAAIGLLIGLLQALTQIQDQTISFVPKIFGMMLALTLCLPWLVQHMVEYSQQLISSIPQVLLEG